MTNDQEPVTQNFLFCFWSVVIGHWSIVYFAFRSVALTLDLKSLKRTVRHEPFALYFFHPRRAGTLPTFFKEIFQKGSRAFGD